MRIADYEFVFDGWQPGGVTPLDACYALTIRNGLPYVEFHVATDQTTTKERWWVTVRCDPCSLDQDRAAYAAMVRADLEKAMK